MIEKGESTASMCHKKGFVIHKGLLDFWICRKQKKRRRVCNFVGLQINYLRGGNGVGVSWQTGNTLSNKIMLGSLDK